MFIDKLYTFSVFLLPSFGLRLSISSSCSNDRSRDTEDDLYQLRAADHGGQQCHHAMLLGSLSLFPLSYGHVVYPTSVKLFLTGSRKDNATRG